MRAIVLAGGKGKRLNPYTYVLPKPLMPIGEMPILELVIMQLKKGGFNHITIAVSHLASLIQAFFGDGSKWNIKIDYFYEEQPLGTAGCISQIPNLEDDFLVMNGDVFCNINFSDFINYHRKHQGLVTIATFQRQQQVNFGVIKADSDNIVTDYIEKPLQELMVSMGIYLIKPEIREFFVDNECVDFPDIIKRLLNNQKRVTTYPDTEYWLDIGREDDYRKASTDFEQLKSKFLGE